MEKTLSRIDDRAREPKTPTSLIQLLECASDLGRENEGWMGFC